MRLLKRLLFWETELQYITWKWMFMVLTGTVPGAGLCREPGAALFGYHRDRQDQVWWNLHHHLSCVVRLKFPHRGNTPCCVLQVCFCSSGSITRPFIIYSVCYRCTAPYFALLINSLQLKLGDLFGLSMSTVFVTKFDGEWFLTYRTSQIVSV